MKARPGALLVLALLVCPAQAGAQAIIAGHTATDLGPVPDSAIATAAGLRLLVRHASVGGNISSGLDTLHTQNARYDRSLWSFQNRGNPGWQAKVDDLVAQAGLQASSFDVLTMKFCYIDPDASFTTYRDALLQLEAVYPTKRFVWWTIPIETSGDTARQVFNDQVRAYALSNGELLFDIADIESHNAAGEKRTDTSGRELMWPEWTSDGGHLNSAGAVRVASALWWLMARIGGWTPTAGPLTFHTLAPCRVVDTRNATGPWGGPALAAGTTRTFEIAGQCGVPADAGAVALNVTVTNATALGSLTVYPGTGPTPGTSTVFFAAGRARANNATIGLVDGVLSVANHQQTGTVDLIVDVSGYFR
ncbi:MAG TPA: hypothetical protein VE129_12580 [Thermoanaerobaculia bacterium]|nr:hypothetical protein [Thermoanaerobaculia bacterium]